MPHASVNGIRLYYEQAGSGTPLVFLHEYGGDYRSWEPQLRHFARRYRCITFSARGYPPSAIPERQEQYSQEIAVEDARGLLDALGIERAHLCGLSLGANTALHFGRAHPGRTLSLALAGIGHGSVEGAARAHFEREIEQRAQRLLREGMAAVAEQQAHAPSRLPYRHKDPRGWAEFKAGYASHSALGCALVARGVMLGRPNLLGLEAELRGLSIPTLVLLADQDANCIEGSWFLKRTLPLAGLEAFPRSGHTLNLEEPERFNRALSEFLSLVEAGRWQRTDE
ncbi:MAG: alpha/beta fold hydrolase [Candidatus Lambdaproteobacteria bacterium]|nr:alpha/beta fold hydrolase [Candidatus Lambdaproteobacteria bacterium]